MRLAWKDGGHVRAVEVAPDGAGRYRVTVDGELLDLEVERLGDDTLRLRSAGGEVRAMITTAGARRFVRLDAFDFVLEREVAGRRRRDATQGGLEAPMPGVVTRVAVAPGDAVTKGQALVSVEAMKMEHQIRAPRDGRVARVTAVVGGMVAPGQALVELED